MAMVEIELRNFARKEWQACLKTIKTLKPRLSAQFKKFFKILMET